MNVRLFSPRPAEGSSFSTGSGPNGAAGQYPVPGGRLREAAALLLFAGSLFLSLALASYRVDPSDPSLSGSNWAGAAGAALAAILVQGFGIVAWLVPLDLAFFAAPLFKGRRAEAVGLRIA